MASLRFLLLLAVAVVAFVAAQDESDEASNESLDEVDAVSDISGCNKTILEFFKALEVEEAKEEDEESRRRRSADDGYGQGYASYGHGGYGSYGDSYGSHGQGGFGGGYNGGYGGHQGYSGGYGYGGNNGYNNGHVRYDQSYTKSPVLTFVKGFKPGKVYLEKGKVVRNYYRHGTYQVALQHYKFIPVIKVVPFTTYDTVGFTGHVQAHNDYTAVICKDCYGGLPKIDIQANKSPYNLIKRRFIYMPNNYRLDGQH